MGCVFFFNCFIKDQNEVDLEKLAAQEQKDFAFEALVAATKNFHPTLKLGEGGFGPVYKVKLSSRLSLDYM